MCYSYICCEKAACKLNGKNSGSLAELSSYWFMEPSLRARLCSKCFECNSSSQSNAPCSMLLILAPFTGKETEHRTVPSCAQGEQLMHPYMECEPRESGSRIHSLNHSIHSEDLMKVSMKSSNIHSSKHSVHFTPLSLI